MAKIKKPTKKTKGTPPLETNASNNLTKTNPQELRPLNFRVPNSFKKEFKQKAVALDISMVELLRRAFEHYNESVN